MDDVFDEVAMYRVTYANQDGIIGVIEATLSTRELWDYLQGERELYPEMRILAERKES
jgi:hypothetical protein